MEAVLCLSLSLSRPLLSLALALSLFGKYNGYNADAFRVMRERRRKEMRQSEGRWVCVRTVLLDIPVELYLHA